MSIEIKLSPYLTRFTNNQSAVEVNGSTTGKCLDHLVKRFPDLKPALFDKKGRLQHYLDVYVNGASVYPDTLTKPVKDGDKLHIVIIITGG